MKKIIITLSAFLAVLSSCSQSDITPINSDSSENIKFAPYASRYTKSTPLTIGQLQSQGFKVYANILGASFGSFINNLSVSYNSTNPGTGVGGNGVWGYSGTPYKWVGPSTNIEFFAYSEKSGLSVTGNKIVPIIKNTAAAQEDILVADKVTASQGQVNFTFKHVLSQLDFQIICDKGVEAEILDFEIQGVCTKSSGLNITTGTFDTPVPPTAMSTDYSLGGAGQFPLVVNSGSSSARFSSLGTTPSGAFMLLPQNFTPWDPSNPAQVGARIKISYKLKYDGVYVLGTSGSVVDTYFPLAKPTNGWEKGKKYLYTLSLSKSGSGSGSGSGGYNPGGGPLLDSKPILFGVSEISTWNTDEILSIQ